MWQYGMLLPIAQYNARSTTQAVCRCLAVQDKRSVPPREVIERTGEDRRYRPQAESGIGLPMQTGVLGLCGCTDENGYII